MKNKDLWSNVGVTAFVLGVVAVTLYCIFQPFM